MVVSVNNETLWAVVQPILPLIEEEKVQELKRIAPLRVIGADGYLSLTIGQFAQLITANNLSAVVPNITEKQLTAFEYLTLDGLRDFVEGYIKQLEQLTLAPTREEKAAANACMKVGIIEGLLCFAREYFGLHSFADAEKVTLAELRMAKKDAYNKAAFSRAYADIMQKATKKGLKR